jgi:glycosyltransferase involved in cell wall biosynthesis
MHRIDRNGLRAPALVIDIELTRLDGGAETKVPVGRYNAVWCLTRVRGIPTRISYWDVADESTVRLGDICARSGDTENADAIIPGLRRESSAGPAITVVVCTRDRPIGLHRALTSLRDQSDTDFGVLVIDNAPSSKAAAAIVDELNLARCQYIIESRPGLSRARNRALNEIRTELVAWIDDDEVADVDWVGQLRVGFAHDCSPVAVCGMMLPAELESEAQVRFEQYGGFNKGRGLSAEVLLAGSRTVHSALYPLPSFGPGGNMAFRVDALRSIGGFDPFLGAGTRTHGGEETRVLAALLRSGATILHWPAAITWHYHRREMAALRDQLFGYSSGLSAFYVSMVRSDPTVMVDMLRLVPHALSDLGSRSGKLRSGQLPIDFPKDLLRVRRWGLLGGPFLYAHEAINSWSERRRHGSPLRKE